MPEHFEGGARPSVAHMEAAFQQLEGPDLVEPERPELLDRALQLIVRWSVRGDVPSRRKRRSCRGEDRPGFRDVEHDAREVHEIDPFPHNVPLAERHSFREPAARHVRARRFEKVGPTIERRDMSLRPDWRRPARS